MNKYVEDLEKRIEALETALEANKKNFHVLTPDEKYILVKPFIMVDKFICSFSRDLNRVLYNAGKTSPIWVEDINITKSYSQSFEYLQYTIPKGTIFKIKCYEVKKRKQPDADYDFVRTIIEHFPGVPEAKGKILNLKRKHFCEIQAESYKQ